VRVVAHCAPQAAAGDAHSPFVIQTATLLVETRRRCRGMLILWTGSIAAGEVAGRA
jgi:hypothetical protein